MHHWTPALYDIVRLAATTTMRQMVIIEEYDAELDTSALRLNSISSLDPPVGTVKEVMDARKFRFKRRRSIPKALDLHLEFRNLTYTVQQSASFPWMRCFGRNQASLPDSPGAKVLLHNISGAVSAGEILAVMGPSGCGKSTLIDAVAQRIARESLQGSILVNGEEVKDNVGLMRSISSYVMQEDLLFPMLTGGFSDLAGLETSVSANVQRCACLRWFCRLKISSSMALD
ncbi:hypothetical protein R1flu_023070 [Riccia fluitans]|uniref:ABC transporter domain-containing protein n=1 Tax=Riccia fluitans TaxID=41844 RepID=A0ABD1XQZ4_9MARC